uniref:Exocyst subunit Exo70 family protein n=1 Tax=Noccaea caerulescens TaxID=107243 RepID=A0A1J3D3Q2_NOCCA
MIANGMISSTIYKKLRKKVIVDAFSRLGFEKLNSTQMMKLEWEIKKWMPVTTVAVTTLFNGERILCDHIFSSSVVESSFVEITLESALNLFVLPITVAKCRKTAEKIYPTLDVYQTILHLIPKIEQIFSYDLTASVRSQAAESLEKLRRIRECYDDKIPIADSRWRSPSAHEVCHELHRLPR